MGRQVRIIITETISNVHTPTIRERSGMDALVNTTETPLPVAGPGREHEGMKEETLQRLVSACFDFFPFKITLSSFYSIIFPPK